MINGKELLDDLERRGLIQGSTDRDELQERLEDSPVTLYCGFDPTADSLHIGNLVPLLLLYRFQQAGHIPLALAGGATGMIGDPSGRSEERNLLDTEILQSNLAAITNQLAKFLDFETTINPARVVNNYEWTNPMGILEFLRDVGKHVTVNTMLAKESVKTRLASEAGISFTEFSYMLLQAHDFAWLSEHENCEMQVGGSDQWGNITAGIDLIRRRTGKKAFGLTVPLVTRADGAKFGKTADGAIWLDATKTSPYQFYQYWMNVDDRDVERFLLQMTILSVDQIRQIMDKHEQEPESRYAQKELAAAVTAFIHGKDNAEDVAEVSRGFMKPVRELSQNSAVLLAAEIPSTEVNTQEWLSRSMIDLLVHCGLAQSKGEARRGIAGNGFTINDERIQLEQVLEEKDLIFGKYVYLRKGKKTRHVIIFDNSLD